MRRGGTFEGRFGLQRVKTDCNAGRQKCRNVDPDCSDSDVRTGPIPSQDSSRSQGQCRSPTLPARRDAGILHDGDSVKWFYNRSQRATSPTSQLQAPAVPADAHQPRQGLFWWLQTLGRSQGADSEPIPSTALSGVRAVTRPRPDVLDNLSQRVGRVRRWNFVKFREHCCLDNLS